MTFKSSKSKFRHGLVVGKFSPLHRGHELLINHAIADCREVTVISFAKPEYPGCGAERREQWLSALFPGVHRLVVTDEKLARLLPGANVTLPHDDEPETVHRRFVGFLCRVILNITVDSVFTSEDYGDGFAAELSDYFREYDPDAQKVTHILVDRERTKIPISGSAARADIHAARNLLSPIVYASFIKRICILGGESSGKSTLAEALAEHYKTEMVPEYGRELWEEKNGALVFEDMSAIAARQVEMEDAAILKAFRYLFCDTSPLTTLLYSRYLFGRSDEALEQLAQRGYDLYILCAPDFDFVQDGTRQEPGFRHYQHEWYIKELTQRGIAWLHVSGNVEERVKQIEKGLDTGCECRNC